MVEGPEPAGPVRRVLLVGFMGAGKSAVGDALAREMGWAFRDFDREISDRVGLPIPRIFEEYGEQVFRSLEDRVGRELLGMDRAVLASGGGWPCRPGRMEGLGASTLTVWLRVSPEDAVRRCRGDGPVRPLLETEDPLARARDLLASRAPFYGMARWAVDSASGEPEVLAGRLAERIRKRPERPTRE